MKTSSTKTLGGVCAIPRSTKRSLIAAMQIVAMISCLWVAHIGTAHAQEVRFFRIVGQVPVTIIEISANGSITWTNQITNTMFTVQIATTLASGSAWVDYIQVAVSNAVNTLRIFDPAPPADMVLIPAGTFTMGATPAEDATDDYPLHTVYVSAFYMDKYEVTVGLWYDVKGWSTSHGYNFPTRDYGLGNGPNYPVDTLSWYGMAKWCNARSEREGRTPAYYTDAALTTVYKTGQVEPYVNWSADGYRFPTEAEWEKAARGGLSGHRFPWGDTETITHSRANYYSYQDGSAWDVPYDVSPTSGWHPIYMGASPVGSFAPNGYGLYDMAGDVSEWCWDWSRNWGGPYSTEPQSDPRGASSGSFRALRGGSWKLPGLGARSCRVWECSGFEPHSNVGGVGFRCARSAGQ